MKDVISRTIFYNFTMKWFSGIVVFGAFTVLFLFEKRKPLRPSVESRSVNTARNLAIAAAAGLAVNYLEKPVTDKVTGFVEANRFGILKFFRLPKTIETVLAVLLLDYTLYIWHFLTHKLPFLWRFHQVHHADLDLTASTAIRFHFGEISISVLFRAGQILLIGVSPEALRIWQNLLLISIFFHHSNINLPKNLEEKLQMILITPRLHGIHHSEMRSQMDSNWSSGLIFWDKLHNTFRNEPAQNEFRIGVEDFDSPEEVSLLKMLVEPFISQHKSQNERLRG